LKWWKTGEREQLRELLLKKGGCPSSEGRGQHQEAETGPRHERRMRFLRKPREKEWKNEKGKASIWSGDTTLLHLYHRGEWKEEATFLKEKSEGSRSYRVEEERKVKAKRRGKGSKDLLVGGQRGGNPI